MLHAIVRPTAKITTKRNISTHKTDATKPSRAILKIIPISAPNIETALVTLMWNGSIYTIHIPIAINTGNTSSKANVWKKLIITSNANMVIEVYLVSSLLSLIMLNTTLPTANTAKRTRDNTKLSCSFLSIISITILAIAKATISFTANAFFLANLIPFI